MDQPARLGRCGHFTRRGSSCDACRPAEDRRRRNPERDTGEARRAARAAVREWVELHGWICPGYRTPAHASRDLTADHPVAVANGGAMVGQRLGVLCRSCNSRRGTRTDGDHPPGFTGAP